MGKQLNDKPKLIEITDINRGVTLDSRGIFRKVESIPSDIRALDSEKTKRKVTKLGISLLIRKLPTHWALAKTAISLTIGIVDDVVTALRKLDLVESRIKEVQDACKKLSNNGNELIKLSGIALGYVKDRNLSAIIDPMFHDSYLELSQLILFIPEFKKELHLIKGSMEKLIKYSEILRRQLGLHSKHVAKLIDDMRLFEYGDLKKTINRIESLEFRLNNFFHE